MTGSSYVQEIKIILTSTSKEMIEELRTRAYGDFNILIKSGVFGFKNGMAEIHRDNEGKIREISIKSKTFKQ